MPNRPHYITPQDVFDFISTLQDNSIDLFLTDPPYMGIVKDSWDNQWKTVEEYVTWMYQVLEAIKPKMKEHGSVIFFGGIGKHNERPFFKLMDKIETNNLYTYRNLITWSKRRAYGKSHDYLFCREEFAWYSVSPERTKVTFNIPLTNIKRGYDGWNSKYKAKSEFKRVSNVWTDIPELMRPKRNTQKPLELMERIINTHSNPGDLVVDTFCGWGTTGVAALKLGRDFRGCERIEKDAMVAEQRCLKTAVEKFVLDRIDFWHESSDVASQSLHEYLRLNTEEYKKYAESGNMPDGYMERWQDENGTT